MEIISEARKIASRENGKKGGVKTHEGKMISRRNAIKHGILANAIRNDYDKLNVEALHRQLAEEFNVSTVSQHMIVEQLVVCYLRLARCARFESELIHEAMNTRLLDWKELEHLIDTGKDVQNGAKATLNEEAFSRMELVITRYEPQLQKTMIALIEKLQSLQRDKDYLRFGK